MGQLIAGTVFAGHRIEELIGRGGMGVVYRARHLRLDRIVALKVMAAERLEDPVLRERFLREAKAAASIDHPNVIPLHYTGEEEGVVYLAMRFVDGEDLRSLVRHEGALAPDQAADIAAQAGEGLDAIHAAGYVHRDVKPANLLLARGGHVYVTDFGVAKRAITDGGATQTGHWVGTLDYAAPEQIRGGPVDARTDVYALGGVLTFMLTGHAPYERDTDEARIYAHLVEPPPRPSAVRPELPPALDAVVERAMAKHVDDRHASAGDLGKAARAAARGERSTDPERVVATGAAAPGGANGEHRLAPDDPTRSAPHRRGTGKRQARRRRLVWTGALAAAAVAAATAIVLTRDDGEPPATGRLSRPLVRVGPTIAGVGKRPNGVAAAAGDVWVTSSRGERLVRVDGASGRVQPGGPRVGRGRKVVIGAGDELWAGNARTRVVVRVDARSGRVTARRRMPAPPVALDTDADSLWVATSSTLLRYDRRTQRRTERIPVPGGIGAMTAAPGGVWAAERRTPTVVFVDADGGRTVERVGLPRPAYDLEFGGGYLWASIRSADSVARIDPQTRAVVTVAAVRRPAQLAMECGLVFVAGYSDHTVVTIDPSQDRPAGRRLPTGLSPLAVAAGDGRVWVTALGSNTVTRLDCA